MLATVTEIFSALWQFDLAPLTNPGWRWFIYGTLIAILILENGLLPTTFLPGDSLLFLTGVLASQGTLDYVTAVTMLTFASGIGGWLGYLQGKWLSKKAFMQRWIMQLPQKQYNITLELLRRHDVFSLILARFMAFIRTLMPYLIALSIHQARDSNWLTG